MAPTASFQNIVNRATWFPLAVAVLGWGVLARAYWSLPVVRLPDHGEVPARSWPATSVPVEGGLDWSVFEGPARSRPAGGRARFRLAGIFFAYQEGGTSRRKAIIDDLEAGTQVLVGEGDQVGGARVARIFSSRVALDDGGRELMLWLSFRGVGERAAVPGADDAQTGGQADARFGKRVGERRWVFKRSALLGYYRNLLDDPARLGSLFASLKPVYEGADINGYEVDMEGESEFFDGVGLMQGDRVMRVNSLPMTNRRRAEYFITEFVSDRVNAFVLDVVRDGQTHKLVYLVR